MSRIAIIGALALLASACGKAPETAAPAAPVAETPAAPAVTPADPAASGESFGEAVGKFDPAKNRFIWVLPVGVHGEAPWTMNVTVKHKGEVKFETKILLTPEIVAPGTYAEFPSNSEAVRLKDSGAWASTMTEVNSMIDDLIAKFGRGDGELMMETELNTTLDDIGRQKYCAEKVSPVVQVYFEETSPPKLTKLDMAPMAVFFANEVLEDCPK